MSSGAWQKLTKQLGQQVYVENMDVVPVAQP
jgi:hypothetical protein